MRSPIIAPEVGELTPVLNLWFVRPGDHVFAGDRVAELLLDGTTFDVSAPETGVLAGTAARPGAQLAPGQVLGWIEKECETN
jgi:pyruvate/2-oxoglutarate dehydrogenase complex dihydrolipoamide acyltransferase (E2) component